MKLYGAKSRILPLSAMLTGLSLLLSILLTNTKTIAVYDGADVVVVNTLSADPMAAVQAAGLELAEEDQVLATDDAADGFGVVQVTRAFPVQITADGKTHMLRTTGGSVGSILADAGITLQPEDNVSPAADEKLTAEGDITVRRVMVKNEEIKESIPYESRSINTPDLRYGQSRVSVQGQVGEKTTTYRVEYRDGEEYSRTLLASEVTKQPVTEIVENGTGGVVEYNGQTYGYSQVYTMKATAYTTEGKSWKKTASGTIARVGAVAVDRKVIPLGSKLLIHAADGSWMYGLAVAEDTGGSIKGNRIDLYFNTYRECINFGVRNATVYVLD